jgi:quinoprotein glucose dehydrogenase
MILLAILLVVFGLPMLVGGVWLITLGGSWYYALAGTTLIIIALLVKPRRTFAQTLYA